MSVISPVQLLQDLIRFDTSNPPGNEVDCVAYINRLLTNAGFETTLVARVPERPNLITRLRGRGNASPLLLHGHVDVVTTAHQHWTYPPFEGRIADGYIWGRGTLDMKSGVAMMLAALLRAKVEGLQTPGDVVLAVLCDEEAGSDYGARYVVENHREHFEGIRYAIGEFGGASAYFGGRKFYPIQVAEKQICWMKAHVSGPGGHGSLPMRGGAMAKAAHLIQQLEKENLPVHITPVTRQMFETMSSAMPLPRRLVVRLLLYPWLTDSMLRLFGERAKPLGPLFRNTVNPTIVHGGDKINVIPSEITLELDGRLLPGQCPDNMMAELHHVIGREVTLELLRHDPCPAEPDMALFNTLAGVLREAVPDGVPLPLLLPGVTDARFFGQLGIQTYGFTPMNLPEDVSFWELAHGADERIPIEAVEFGANMIYRLLQCFG